MSRLFISFLARYGLTAALTFLFVFLVTLKNIGQGFSSLAFVVVFISARYGGRGPALFATGLITILFITLVSEDNHEFNIKIVIQVALLVASGPLIISVVESMSRARLAAENSAVEAARQSERLRTTLQSIGDAVIVTDLEGHVISLNPVAEDLTGWSQRMAAGRHLDEVFKIIGEQSGKPVQSPLERVLKEKVILDLADHTMLVSRDGCIRPIDDSAAPILRDRGETDGVVLVFRDISTRRASERQLATAESRFRAFMDHSPIVAYLKDEEGRYLWGNTEWSRFHEGRGLNAVGLTDFDLWPRDIATTYLESDAKALTSQTNFEVIETTENRDGSTSHWMTLKFPVDEPDGSRSIGGVAVDVTHRIVAEKTIRESEARYRLLFESNPHPMWVFDTATLGFLAVNEAAVQHYGYSRDEFLALTIDQIRPTSDVDRLHNWLERASTTSFNTASPWIHRKKDGTIIEVEIASHSIEFEGRSARVVLVNDVTVRRVAEEALRVNRQRLDLVIDGTSLGLWYCDLPAAVLTLNDRAKVHFNLPPDTSLTLASYVQKLHPDDREQTSKAISRAIDFQERFDVEHRVAIDDNSSRWIRAIGRAFFDDSGAAIRFDGISIDVTDRKEVEQQLLEAKESAVVANRAKSRFLAMVGHELRTPLNPILASVSALLTMTDASENRVMSWTNGEIRDLLTMIRRNVELETRLIGDLLDMSRTERGELHLEMEPVDVHAAIRQAVEICQEAIIVSKLDVQMELFATKHEVEGDHARIMQIVWNLIHNAAKFTSPAGRLILRTSNLPGNSSGTVNERVRIEFEDNGPGIEPELLDRIFKPFDQGGMKPKSRTSGLGLGLAISRSIAEAHGGKLIALSQGQNQGATFRFELELRTHSPCHDQQARHESTDLIARTRILLVEDNEDTLRYLKIFLKQHNYQVEIARSTEQANSLILVHDFDLLISDIELPDGSGLDLMRQNKGRFAGIAMSGFGSKGDVDESLDAGFTQHLTKPIDVNRLVHAIGGILNSPT